MDVLTEATIKAFQDIKESLEKVFKFLYELKITYEEKKRLKPNKNIKPNKMFLLDKRMTKYCCRNNC